MHFVEGATVKNPMIRLAMTVLLVGALHAGCGDNDDVIPFTLVTPEGQNTFEGVSVVRLTFGGKTQTKTLSGADDSFKLELELKLGGSGPVLLEGLSAGGEVICQGQSPLISAYPTSETLILFVSRVGTFGRAPVEAPVGATAMAMANYEIEDWDSVAEDDVNATLWFGGLTSDATISTEPFYYDGYFHDTYPLTELPDPRADMVAMNIDAGYFLLYGGFDEAGTLSGRLDIMRPGGIGFEYVTDVDYGLAEVARAGGLAVTLGPYPSLLDGYDHRVLNAFLVVGGRGPSGAACDYLHFAAAYNTSTYDWTVTAQQRPLAGCRLGHTATRTDTSTSTVSEPDVVVLVYGGGRAGDPVAETVRVFPQQPDVDTIDWGFEETTVTPDPGPMIGGHAAVTLADRRILIIGGVTADGTALADGILYDPDDGTFTTLPGLLDTPRHGHTALRLGDELVVAGGTGADGLPLGDAEIFNVAGGDPSLVASVDLVVARTGHQAFPMSTGTLGLIGGVDATGQPTRVIEIYTPGLVD
jgi:hypothetical protein